MRTVNTLSNSMELLAMSLKKKESTKTEGQKNKSENAMKRKSADGMETIVCKISK